MKPIYKLLIVIALLIFCIAFLVYDARSEAPSRFTIRKENLSSTQIDEHIDNVKILFFSDLEYGEFMREERLDSLMKKMNSLQADIILFGGDLYSQNRTMTNERQDFLIDALKSLKAPLGKFAVLGDNDMKDATLQSEVEAVLKQANFEILHNTHKLLRNHSSAAIHLVGLDNVINGNKAYDEAFEHIPSSAYTLVLCHTPDSALHMHNDLIDYFIAGHTHGGQVNLVFYSSYAPSDTVEYFSGKHLVSDDFVLDITNGVGTEFSDSRFLANAEVVLYTLKHIEEEVEETTAPIDTSNEEQPTQVEPIEESPTEQKP